MMPESSGIAPSIAWGNGGVSKTRSTRAPAEEGSEHPRVALAAEKYLGAGHDARSVLTVTLLRSSYRNRGLRDTVSKYPRPRKLTLRP